MHPERCLRNFGFYFIYLLTLCGKIFHSLCLPCWISTFGNKLGTVGTTEAPFFGAERPERTERNHAGGKQQLLFYLSRLVNMLSPSLLG